jgi:nucleoside-diphosphate-sugar epimerase
LKLLLIGGTKFLGRATVEAALDRGHEVTLLTRGQTNPELFPEAEKLRGDRSDPEALSLLAGREWDAVVDTCGYLPKDVRASAEAVRDSVGRYLFVSSISAYADFREGPSEGSKRAELEDGQPSDELMAEYENYGALKALCEDAVLDAYGDRGVIVRPGLIVGPHDPTGRFTYWPHRIARGGDFVVPAPSDGRFQLIDVRDLAAWLVALCERGASGAYNATHSGLTWAELVESGRRVTGSDARPVWIDQDWLAEQGVGEWMELPMWLHDPEWVGMNQADSSRAVAAGLGFRPLDDTVRATLEQAATTEDAGLRPERELELLEAWSR